MSSSSAGSTYPVYRLAVIAVGLIVGIALWYVVTRTRLGMLIRAGASNRTMVAALGVNIRLLYTVVFGFGAALAGLAGVMAGPIYSVQPGMGELILIQVFVVIVIGGIGSVRGALVGALIVGVVDTLGRVPQAGARRDDLPDRRRLGRPGARLDADLPPDGGGAAFRPRASSAARMSTRLVLWSSRCWRSWRCRRSRVHRPAVLHRPRAAHHDPRHRRGQPEPDPRLRRPGLVRPRRLSRRRRLRGRHPRLLRLHQRLAASGGRGRASALVALAIGAVSIRTSGIYFIMITLAFSQMLYYLGISIEEFGGDDGMRIKVPSQFPLVDLATRWCSTTSRSS